MTFDYNISTLAIVLLGCAFFGLLYIIIVYLGCLRSVRRRCNECNSSQADAAPDVRFPKASVVVCARNDAAQLSATLPAILQQDYPSFEVIVVNDGSPDQTDAVVTALKARYPNLYLTYVPDNTRNISRKKLAIQLGVKAAKGEVIVVTDASTQVASANWLAKMVTPFSNPSVEVVLGFNFIKLPPEAFAGRLITAFDCAADAVAWLSAAVMKHPYRGCSNNIAYRRDLYFKNNGFHSSFNLRYGDDDLFVNEIVSPHNTVVQLSADTLGRYGGNGGVRKRYRRQRRRHAFTGRTLPKASRRIMALGEWLLWLVPALSIAGACVSGLTNIFGWAIAALIMLVMYISVIIGWRTTVKALGGPVMMFTIPFLAAFRPFRNMMVAFAARPSNNAWYTWQ